MIKEDIAPLTVGFAAGQDSATTLVKARNELKKELDDTFVEGDITSSSGEPADPCGQLGR